MVVFEIKLPKSKNPETFAAFMRDEYLPAVHRGATRRGVVTSISLSQRRNLHAGDDFVRSFLMRVGWEGIDLDGLPRVDSDDVKAKLDGFNLDVKCLGEFDRVAEWKAAS